MSQYKDTIIIGTIILKSPDVNLLDISPGNSKDCIAEKLKGTNFKITDGIEDIEGIDRIIYKSSLLYLYFELSADGTINQIIAAINDPYIPDNKRIRF